MGPNPAFNADALQGGAALACGTAVNSACVPGMARNYASKFSNLFE
jgi:hypothetical protein